MGRRDPGQRQPWCCVCVPRAPQSLATGSVLTGRKNTRRMFFVLWAQTFPRADGRDTKSKIGPHIHMAGARAGMPDGRWVSSDRIRPADWRRIRPSRRFCSVILFQKDTTYIIRLTDVVWELAHASAYRVYACSRGAVDGSTRRAHRLRLALGASLLSVLHVRAGIQRSIAERKKDAADPPHVRSSHACAVG